MKDPDSPVWRQGDDLQGSRNEICISITRKAVDLYHLENRYREITLLRSEMNNAFEHFSHNHQLLKACLQNENTGRDLLIRRKLLSIEGYLLQLKGLFGDHVEDLSLPDLAFQGEIHSVRYVDENALGAISEVPCVLSLSGRGIMQRKRK